MALRCGSDVPEQITKKSVKVEMPRKSKARMSSAFLSKASWEQTRASFSEVIFKWSGKVDVVRRGRALCRERDSVSTRLWQRVFEFPWRKCQCGATRSETNARDFLRCDRARRIAPAFSIPRCAATYAIRAHCPRR